MLFENMLAKHTGIFMYKLCPDIFVPVPSLIYSRRNILRLSVIGKSSVINALLGKKYLAEGILPTTNEISILRCDYCGLEDFYLLRPAAGQVRLLLHFVNDSSCTHYDHVDCL